MIDLAQHWQVVLVALALIMSRMLAAFSLIPFFVGNSVPVLVRTAFVAALALAVLPMVLAEPGVLAHVTTANMSLYAAKEAGLGLVLGLLAGSGFWVMYTAGTIIEYQAGLTMATTMDPLGGQNDSLVGGLLMQLYTVLFLLGGGLLSLIGMLFESYRIWPLSSLTPVIGSLKLAQIVVHGFEQLLLLAFKVAAPFLILMLAVELALGLLSRFAPQLNVFFLAMPLKILVLAVLLLLYGVLISGSPSLLPTVDFAHLLDPLAAIHE
jgi:type III secretion protein T